MKMHIRTGELKAVLKQLIEVPFAGKSWFHMHYRIILFMLYKVKESISIDLLQLLGGNHQNRSNYNKIPWDQTSF